MAKKRDGDRCRIRTMIINALPCKENLSIPPMCSMTREADGSVTYIGTDAVRMMAPNGIRIVAPLNFNVHVRVDHPIGNYLEVWLTRPPEPQREEQADGVE